MAISFKNPSVTSNVAITQVSTGDLGSATFPVTGATYSNSSLTITKLFQDARQFTTSESLDVTSGLTDFFGTALAFVTVKQIWIYNTSAASITFGGGSNPLFNAFTLTTGGCINLTTNITTGSGVKNIAVSGTGTLTYSIVIMGA